MCCGRIIGYLTFLIWCYQGYWRVTVTSPYFRLVVEASLHAETKGQHQIDDEHNAGNH